METPDLDALPHGTTLVLEALAARKVEHVLIGAAAWTLQGRPQWSDVVALCPAPYGRNLDRLGAALGDLGVVNAPDGAALNEALRATYPADDADVEVDLRPAPGLAFGQLLLDAPTVALAPGHEVLVACPEHLVAIAQTRDRPHALVRARGVRG